MFVTCHINFWPLSNFVGASLEVTRTISNNKLHFTWGCSILLLKKRKRAMRPDSFFFFAFPFFLIAPVLQIQASSMKLRVHGFLFLVFLHIKTDGKNKPFFYNYINIQIRTFFSELVQSKKCGKYCLIIIRIGANTAFLAFSLGM